MCRKLPLAALALSLVVAAAAQAAWLDPATDPKVVVVKDSADARMDGYGGPDGQDEWTLMYGGSGTSRIKGSQESFAMKFDLATHKTKTVVDAELHLCRANAEPIHALAAATINTDWVESSVCWRYRSAGNDWTYSRSDFTTAAYGNNGSLTCYGYNSSGTFNSYTSGSYTWIRVKLDPTFVSAMIQDQYGLVVTDPRGYSGGYNPLVYTKESGTTVQPKLYLKFADAADTTAPSAVGDLTVTAGPENGSVILSFTAPTDAGDGKALGYTVRYSMLNNFTAGTNAARWRIPRPAAAGTTQRMLLEGLPAGTSYYFFVQPYDRTGNVGPVQSVYFTVPAAWTAPSLVDGAFTAPDPAGKTVRSVPGVLRYWAATENAKINPATGNRMEDGYTGSGADDYKKANPVWDAATNTISLSACRNEVVGCQLVLERIVSSLTSVRVTASSLTGPGGTIPASPYIETFQMFYVNSGGVRYPDPAVPLASPLATSFSIPDTNRNPGGVNQSVWIDIYVPKYTGLPSAPTTIEPGEYSGTITVTATQLTAPLTINLKVRVGRTILPDDPSFIVDLNGYGNVWDYGTAASTCLRYFQVTHKHRVCINTLPAGWTGSVTADRQPTSWTTFDNKYGGLFATDPTKSAFSRTNAVSAYYGPGELTPVTEFYTGFNEMWPMSMIDLANGFDPSPALPNCPGQGGSFWNTKVDSASVTDQNYAWDNMPDVKIAWSETYKTGVKNKIADWFTHCATKGYTKTAFQIYLNDKWSYSNCSALWTLEECEAADDFRALNFFHNLYRAGQAQSGVTNVKWDYRIDISDRWGQNWGELNNALNLHVVNRGAGGWWWPNLKYRKHTLAEPERWWWYGGDQGILGSGVSYAQMFLQRWSQGFEGGLPNWDNFQTSYGAANDLSSVYKGTDLPGSLNLYYGPIVANRIKMMRQAQQIIELVNLWAGAEGMSAQKVRDSLKAKYGDGTWDYAFAGLSEAELYKLRADLQAQVEASLYLGGDINGDGWVDVLDLMRLADAWGAASGDPNYDMASDLSPDGAVDVLDLLTLAETWGESRTVPQ